MKRKVSGVTMTVLFISMLMLIFTIYPSKVKGTIYIKTDGIVDTQSTENFVFRDTVCKMSNWDNIVKTAETTNLIETIMSISKNLNWEEAVYAGIIFNKKTKADLETLIENYSVAGDWLNVLKWSAVCKKLGIEDESAIKAALNNLTMVGPLPWTTTYNSKAYFLCRRKICFARLLLR